MARSCHTIRARARWLSGRYSGCARSRKTAAWRRGAGSRVPCNCTTGYRCRPTPSTCSQPRRHHTGRCCQRPAAASKTPRNTREAQARLHRGCRCQHTGPGPSGASSYGVTLGQWGCGGKGCNARLAPAARQERLQMVPVDGASAQLTFPITGVRQSRPRFPYPRPAQATARSPYASCIFSLVETQSIP
jgi:hypothetical protein